MKWKWSVWEDQGKVNGPCKAGIAGMATAAKTDRVVGKIPKFKAGKSRKISGCSWLLRRSRPAQACLSTAPTDATLDQS